MGLDMYLYKREYVSGWNYKEDMDTSLYDLILEKTGLPRCEASPHAYVDVTVAYWRKANSVHRWFCLLDGGRDECQPIRVTVDDLKALRDACEAVLLTPANAESVLPTKSGFFFGSYDYDEWYLADLKDTISQIDSCLAGAEEWDEFTYQASW